MTITVTRSTTFTLTIAQYISSKVAADLRGLNAYYGQPTESKIRDFQEEITILLRGGYLESVEYGFKRNDERVVTLHYEVFAGGLLSDGKSGGVYARANVTSAKWYSFLRYNEKWDALSATEKQRIRDRLPFQRSHGQAPQDGNGYWSSDRIYSSDSVGTQRRTFRSY